MSEQPSFTAEVYQNAYLPAGVRRVDAIITVTAARGSGFAAGATTIPPQAAQVIIVDCSGSMAGPPTKMKEVKRATEAAIDALPDGIAFAIIAGRNDAAMVYPFQPALVPADPDSKAAARHAVSTLAADGGTAIGRWLHLANRLFYSSPATFKHAILLTDGQNQHETPEQLAAVLRGCEGRFICDARGVGDGWVARELRQIASTLLGTADGLEDPSELVESFRAMVSGALGKGVAGVSLRLWTPANSTIAFVKQVFPAVEELTGRRTEVSERIGDYPTGAWGDESRDYHVCVDVPAGELGEEMLAARASLVSGDTVLAQARVLATWTDDTALSTQINKRVAHYTGQAELAAAIQEGLAAREAGDVETATSKLGRAVQLAAESGHADTAKLLARVVEVVDEKTGTVRLRRQVTGADAELANVRSVQTIRVKNA
jgi:hypothetical protein